MICPIDFLAKTPGVALACSTVSGSSGQSAATGEKPSFLKSLPQRSQLLGRSQRPWMKTTGGFPELFAAPISLLSRSDIDAMPDSLGRLEVIRPYRNGRLCS